MRRPALVLLLAAGLVGCRVTSDPDDGGTASPIRTSPGHRPEHSEVECASLEVPVDHTRPQGDTLDAARYRLRGPADDAGSIVLLPGGPAAPVSTSWRGTPASGRRSAPITS